MSHPEISVIIPTYNRCDLLDKTIGSVLAQTFTDYELLVIDDGSTDNTATLMQGYCARYPERIKYAYQPNAGESVARQHGVDISQGALLAFLDSDDLWLPDKLQAQYRFLQQHPNAAYVYCWASLIDKEGMDVKWPVLGSLQTPETFSLEQLIQGNFIVGPGSTLLLRRAAYNQCGGFNPEIQFAEDWDLCLRLGVEHAFGCICEPLVQVRLYARGWHQRRENLPRMLRDHLLLVESFFAIPKVSQSMPGRIKSIALANRYANAGFAHIVYGEITEGTTCLSKAGELAPEQWGMPEKLMQAIANYAISLLAPNHPVERAVTFINQAFCTLPTVLHTDVLPLAQFHAWFYITLAHHCWHLDQAGATIRYISRAWRTDSSWRANRGIWSLFARAWLRKLRLSKKPSFGADSQAKWLVSLVNIDTENSKSKH